MAIRIVISFKTVAFCCVCSGRRNQVLACQIVAAELLGLCATFAVAVASIVAIGHHSNSAVQSDAVQETSALASVAQSRRVRRLIPGRIQTDFQERRRPPTGERFFPISPIFREI